MWNFHTIQEYTSTNFDIEVNKKFKEGYTVKETNVFPPTAKTKTQFIAIMHKYDDQKEEE